MDEEHRIDMGRLYSGDIPTVRQALNLVGSLLSPKDFRALDLRYPEGATKPTTYKDCAAQLGLTLYTTNLTISRAEKHVRDRLAKLDLAKKRPPTLEQRIEALEARVRELERNQK